MDTSLSPITLKEAGRGSGTGSETVRLAEKLLTRSLEEVTSREAAQMKRIARMIGQPEAKNLSLLMTDRLNRSQEAERSARMWRNLVDRFEGGHGFSPLDRALLRLGTFGSQFLPGPAMAAVRDRLRRESRGVILPAEERKLAGYLRHRRETSLRVNLNQLGEAVLGEEEAGRRLQALLRLLDREDVDYVSVKISAIFSQINLAAWDSSLEEIKDRLRVLYLSAMRQGKFINLDMEEYRDLELTVRAFTDVLSEERFHHLSAGIVLQAYLPDSIAVQRELTDWAQDRRLRGGAPIKVRLVKGANLAMERVEAELHGWNPAPHPGKHETDAAFKQMLDFGCRPENAAAVHLGVGSHNLFDVALALTLRESRNVQEFVEIEMLEGMAPAQARAVREKAGQLLLYAPVVKREDWGSALAYLIRRLDENTAPGNFLASLFSLRPGSDSWNKQKDCFLAAWRARNQVSRVPRRSLPAPLPGKGFANEPDSDWTQSGVRSQLETATAWESAPPQAGPEEIEQALERSVATRTSWAGMPEMERAAILKNCARQLSLTRFDTIALLREEAKKAPAEADAEVSEAVDFARYYAETGIAPAGVPCSPLGTVVVTPPWNFPFAIPCGGVLAALMAGNTVILKPAPETSRTGWWLANQLWKAGVPRDVLQFVACSDGEVGRQLIEDPRTSAVILTGAYETARRFQEWRPSLPLFAETSGKNALVVTAMADRELAVRDLVKSAFGHSGQKCSAASLAILEAEVYEDPIFRRQLADAAASLAVGSSLDLRSLVTPLVQPPGEDLLHALTTLDEGEKWLLEPKPSPADPCLWSPGIKLGVRPGSWFHRTECFGPVLGLMRAETLDEAIELQNAVEYGLTAGLHSLDEAEIARWKERVEAGNLYINRGITGAIVRRQPFGGWKRSSVGPGMKAGGPNYVNLFRRFQRDPIPSLGMARSSYSRAWEDHFSQEHDPSALTCERNLFRYRPRPGVLLRLEMEDERAESLARFVADLTGTPLLISRRNDEDDVAFVARIGQEETRYDTLRTLGSSPGDAILRGAIANDLNWIDAPMSGDGRVELTRWLREQTVSETRHRYGNIIDD